MPIDFTKCKSVKFKLSKETVKLIKAINRARKASEKSNLLFNGGKLCQTK